MCSLLNIIGLISLITCYNKDGGGIEMVKSSEIAHEIILKLAKETEREADLTDPYIQKLILELNSVAQISFSNNSTNSGYYSVKDVAELFDVNKQTVYKWIAEEKIVYKTDNSPGKKQRKGYKIPKEQFKTEKDMIAMDPTFSERRQIDIENIPNTDSNHNYKDLPKNGDGTKSYQEIKRNILKRKQ